MPTFEELYQSDLARYGENGPIPYIKKYLKYLRRIQTCGSPILKFYYRARFKQLSEKHGMEIPWSVSIGKGLYLGHAYNILVNPAAVIGKNCNLHRGVVIGQQNRGALKGAPVIGDRVWIGINAAVVGKITVGDDVLIAPNAYVNRDVPPHSLVFGNPCIVKPRENATDQYINHIV